MGPRRAACASSQWVPLKDRPLHCSTLSIVHEVMTFVLSSVTSVAAQIVIPNTSPVQPCLLTSMPNMATTAP